MSDIEPIPRDLRCLVCGYNLRGLTPDRSCPECGLHVQRTVDANDPEGALEREALRWDAQVKKHEEQTERADREQDKAEAQGARYDALLDKWEEHAQRLDRLLDALEALLQKSARGV